MKRSCRKDLRDSQQGCGECFPCLSAAAANFAAEKAKRVIPFPEEKAHLMQTYIFDIDGTLSDCAWRQSHADAKDWDMFHSLCGEDSPIEGVCRLLRNLATDHCIILLTGRSEKNRRATELWCHKHDLRVDDIIMRPDKNFEPAEKLKLAAIAEYFGSIEEAVQKVTLVIDDSEKVVEAFRNAGFTVLQQAHTAASAGA